MRWKLYQVRASQSQLRRPEIREPLELLNSQAGVPVFYDGRKINGKFNKHDLQQLQLLYHCRTAD